MLYLDTGCLVKLYFTEANSTEIAAAVGDEELCLTEFHELELTTALQLKIFRRHATTAQAMAASDAFENDRAHGVLRWIACDWNDAWREARELAARHSASTGCRSFDALHCAVARQLGLELLSTDSRQIALARAAGIAVRAL